MTMENDQGEGERNIVALLLRLIAVIVLFPLLWIGVTVNFLGLSERLSFLPGISDDGGLVSGFSALVFTSLILGALIGGGLVVMGGGFPDFGGGDTDPAQQTTPSPTPTSTPAEISTPPNTETRTPSVTANPSTAQELSGYEAFESEFRDEVSDTTENESYTGVPVLATEYRETDDGTDELWLVFWECDRLDSLKEQRVSISNNYANAVSDHNGSEPDRVRIYGVTNVEGFEDTITYIRTSAAEAAYNRTMSMNDYTENWNDRKREPTAAESDIAFEMVVSENSQQLAEETFNQHHREIRGCPGGVEDPGGDETITRPPPEDESSG